MWSDFGKIGGGRQFIDVYTTEVLEQYKCKDPQGTAIVFSEFPECRTPRREAMDNTFRGKSDPAGTWTHNLPFERTDVLPLWHFFVQLHTVEFDGAEIKQMLSTD